MPEHGQEPRGTGFAEAREFFAKTVRWLSGPQTAGLTHAELEEQLDTRGRELLRRLHQDHLDLRAAREQRHEKVTGADGITRTRVEAGHQRRLATVFGEVTVTRITYRAPGAANQHPADAELNLPHEKHSHGLRKLAVIEAARGSFESAAQAITRSTGTAVGKRQVEQLARRAAADIGAFYTIRRPAPAPDDRLLVLTFDGKGIVMRPEALREATAKAAAAPRRKLATRLSPGEKHSRDPGHRRTWVVLVDGSKQQIEAIQAEARRLRVTVHIVCDFIHVLQYLWKAAWSFFETGDPDAEEWVAQQAMKILNGKAAAVAAGIRRRATTYGCTGAEREGADACASYLTAKKQLRALNASGDFDLYWAFHLRQEHQRIHRSRDNQAA